MTTMKMESLLLVAAWVLTGEECRKLSRHSEVKGHRVEISLDDDRAEAVDRAVAECGGLVEVVCRLRQMLKEVDFQECLARW